MLSARAAGAPDEEGRRQDRATYLLLWSFAALVRTNDVHVVVAADQSPERVMNTFKAYASRALNRTALDRLDRRRWARHGSTRHLWTRTAISAAVHYVVCEQGQPMACFEMAAGARLPTR